TVLVGRNGSGKSNFLDALRFVADAVRTTLAQAVRSRGGPAELWRRGMDSRHPLGIELELDLGDGRLADYGFELAWGGKGYKFGVLSERLEIRQGEAAEAAFYEVDCGELVATSLKGPMPPVSSDRLYLVYAGGFPEFGSVYDALQVMGFYN